MLRRGINEKARPRKGAMCGLHGLQICPQACIRAPSLPLRNPNRGDVAHDILRDIRDRLSGGARNDLGVLEMLR